MSCQPLSHIWSPIPRHKFTWNLNNSCLHTCFPFSTNPHIHFTFTFFTFSPSLYLPHLYRLQMAQDTMASSNPQPKGYSKWARVPCPGWPSLITLSSYKDPPWKAIVGDEKKIYYIHPFVLCKTSSVFEARITGTWKNATDDTLDWSHFNEETIDCVADYLYSGKYKPRAGYQTRSEPPKESGMTTALLFPSLEYFLIISFLSSRAAEKRWCKKAWKGGSNS